MKKHKYVKSVFYLLFPAIVVLSVVLTVSLDVVNAASAPTVAPVISEANNKYVAGKIYAGEYSGTALYYRHNKKQTWMRWSNSGKYQQDVLLCPEALASLDSTGIWIGNLGHGGVCGTTAEPATFAVGNYLNRNSEMDSVGPK